VELGGRVTMTGSLMASEENIISWRGAYDPKAGSLVGDGAAGRLIVQDLDGNPITEELPVVFRRPGWYEATIPSNVDLVPNVTYVLDFMLMATSGTCGHFCWKATAEQRVESAVPRPSQSTRGRIDLACYLYPENLG
jgi:hypothetical protein